MAQLGPMVAPTLFTIFLLFMGFVNYLVMRKEPAPMWIFAALAGLILLVWGGIYLEDVGRLWSGRPRQVKAIGGEAIFALVFTLWKSSRWLHA